jgi:hypothetical protein
VSDREGRKRCAASGAGGCFCDCHGCGVQAGEKGVRDYESRLLTNPVELAVRVFDVQVKV